MIVEKAIQVISNPNAFFDNLMEDGVKSCYLYFVVISIASALLSFVSSFVIPGNILANSLYVFPLIRSVMFFGSGLIFWVIGLAAVFVFAGFLHLILMLFGSRVPYSKTMQTFVYSSTPLYVIGWIPYVGTIAGIIWSIVLVVLALPKTHGISITRSIFATLVYLIVAIIAIVICFIGLFIFLYLGFAGF